MRGSLRGLAFPGIAALAGIAVLLALGFWQLNRLAWKEALIARVEMRFDAPPAPAPGPADWPALDLAAAEYEPVTVTGRFQNDREVYVVTTLTDPKGPARGVGYLVMTPLTTAGGWSVYVNRGFVPRERKYANTRPEGQVEGEITVTGLLRAPRKSAWFEPGDGISDNEWFSRDPQAFAAVYGPSGPIAPYIIDAFFDPALPGGLPQGGETIVSFPNNHFGYALTWFGLAAALAGVFAAFAWSRLKT
jgi:surfeit locus 1 family protein